MLRFLFKSQLSDRNALPFYIALKTPVVCMDRKNGLSSLQLHSNSLASGAVFHLYRRCTYRQFTKSGRCGDTRVQGGNIHSNNNWRQVWRWKIIANKAILKWISQQKKSSSVGKQLKSFCWWLFLFVSYWSNCIKSEWQKKNTQHKILTNSTFTLSKCHTHIHEAFVMYYGHFIYIKKSNVADGCM